MGGETMHTECVRPKLGDLRGRRERPGSLWDNKLGQKRQTGQKPQGFRSIHVGVDFNPREIQRKKKKDERRGSFLKVCF